MNEYRITKYDPANRNELGHYRIAEEWSDFSDIGDTVTLEEYVRTEKAYIDSAIEFMSQDGIISLKVTSLEDHEKQSEFKEGEWVDTDLLSSILRSILRNEFWCRLESDSGFIHFGWDYYMYIGVTEVSAVSIKNAENRRLFVEEFISPYHPENC